ncbi:multidrug resistance-associated protein 1-like isoform X2 [Planococcus citri]|uniref:multidrug resistance-associated protein 1-like isoform X2 n=1 Tax=Planococcus citri TaxID=170843 RepID=UPI0031F9F9A4
MMAMHSMYIGSQDYSLHTYVIIQVLYFGLSVMHVRKKIASPGISFLFSLISVLCGLPQLRTEIRFMEYTSSKYSSWESYLYAVIYATVIILFVLNCFADSTLTNKYENPEERASFVSKSLMIWMHPYVLQNYKNRDTLGNLWNVDYRTTILYSMPIFEKYWKRKSKTIGKIQNYMSEKSTENDSTSNNISLRDVLMRISKPFLKMIIIANLIAALFQSINNQVINPMITFMLGGTFEWHGYYFAILLLFYSVIGSIFSVIAHKIIYKMKLCQDIFLPSIIYRKALRLSTNAQKIYDNSKIIDLITSETDSLTNRAALISKLFMTCLVAIFCMVYVVEILGVNTIILLIVLGVLFIIEESASKKISENMRIKSSIMRKRLKLTQDVLNGYKVLKLYAWEAAYENEILNYRNAEIKLLEENKKMESMLGSLWFSFSIVVLLCPILSLLLLNEQKGVTIQQIFHLIGLINSLNSSCLTFPQIVSSIQMVKYSLRKINNFLNAEERDNEYFSANNGYALSIENGNFSRYKNENKEILKNINIHISKTKLVAVIGPLGSGKTSLLLAFLNELHKSSGTINKQGTIAYADQQAWILNKTVKDNIIMNKPFIEEFYNTVIEACALKPDIDSFSNGSLTLIGEKGINLSGGQKQRISLARAVYTDADIYLLDDIFSALDLSSASHIFQNVIGPDGLLKQKTRVIVTHNTQFLSQMDFIVMLNNQTIVKSDSYANLKDTDEDFIKLMNKFSNKIPIKENIGKIDDIMESKGAIPIENSDIEISNIFIRPKTKYIDLRNNSSTQVVLNETISNNLAKSNEIETTITKLSSTKKLKKEKGIIMAYRDTVHRGDLLMSASIVIMCIVYHIFRIFINLALAYWSMKINEIHATNLQYLEILIALIIISFVICFIYQASIGRISFNISRHAHDKLLSTFMKWPMVLFEAIPSSRIINRVGLYLSILDDRTSSYVAVVLIKKSQVFVTLLFAVYVNPFYLIMVILSFIFVYITEKLTKNRVTRLVEEISKQTSIISAHTSETLLGLTSIRAMNLQSYATQKMDEIVQRKAILQNNRDQYLIWTLFQKFMIWILLSFVGVLAVIFKRQDPIEITGFVITYLLTMPNDFYICDKLKVETDNSINSLRRITEYIDTPCENLTEKNTIRPSWPENGTIVFRNLKVRYRRSGTLILKNLNFRVNSGEKVGVIGRTGAGKTSLISSIFRMTEFVNGSIEIDDVDITTIALYDLRSRLTVIPQDPVLFSGTLRLNLDPLKEHSDEKLWAILQQAHLKSFVNNLPNKLDYVIGAGGESISVGQKQLICLARALLRRTKILILDEATASVDLDTDALIQSTIQSEFKHSTVLTIAHRIQTVFNYDKILVLDNGSVMEYDTPENLIQNENSVFHKLASIAQLI